MKKRKFAAIALVAVMVLSGCRIQYVEEETTTEEIKTEGLISEESIEINLWYYDDVYTPYLSQCEKDYENANANVEVNLVQISESGYVDSLVAEAIGGGNSIDLYLINNDNLEQVKLAGLTKDNNMADIFSEYNYSQAALRACTYNGSLIAYPMSFNTSFVVYNKAYVADHIPATFEDIENFADAMEVPEGAAIRSIFSCDLNDIFYNYGFLGGVLNIGGTSGDDKSVMFEITQELTDAVGFYKGLIDFFYIDIDSVDYYSCINDFESGAILFTIADTNMLNRIASDVASEEDTETVVDYGVIPFPDLNGTIPTSPLSVTTAVVVNPFGKNTEVAESFAKYISYTNAGAMFDSCGKVAARALDTNDEILSGIYASYEKSTPKLKVMYNEEFYALLEVSMHLMARNEDDVQALTAVSSYLNSQWEAETTKAEEEE